MNDMTPKEYERWYKAQRPKASNAPAWIGLAVVMCVGLLIGAAVLIDMYPKPSGANDTQPTTKPTQIGNVGGQAPVVVRGSYSSNTATDSRNGSLSDTDYNATSQAQFDAAVLTTGNQAQAVATATPDLGPLPVNSAGAPIIDLVQQQQLNFSAEMAAQEAQASVDNARATDVASRPPDVSKADAEQMMHRDLCHVPRADPHTCEQGLYKPTPVN